jgi:transposase-like protein
MKHLYKNRAWMYKRYVEDKKSLESIATEAGVTQMTIYNWLIKHNIINQKRSWNR